MKDARRYFDLVSIGVILLATVLSLARFSYLPQYVDDYYHICVARGFLKSGGWIGWSWWDYAPFGRPQIYPPLYHLLLVFLNKLGFSFLTAVRISEAVIPGVFFFFLWRSLRIFNSSFFSLVCLLSLSGFFSFYSSLSANLPASLSLTFGFLSWYYLVRKKIISSSIFLLLSSYSHAGIFWIFVSSLVFLCFLKEYRKISLKVLVFAFSGFSFFLLHQLRYLKYLRLELLRESYFIHLNIFIVSLGIISVFFFFKKNFRNLLFLGFLIGSGIVFIRYPYRLLSAQGIIGFTFFSSLLLENIFFSLRRKMPFFLFLFLFLFLFQSTLNWKGEKIELNLLDSTYYNYFTTRAFRLLEFTSLFWPRFYRPIIEVIKNNSRECEIISSNLKLTSQIFSALSGRPTSNSILYEVKPEEEEVFRFAKVIVWMKTEKRDYLLEKKMGWQKVYENEIAYVFRNPSLRVCVVPLQAKINFKIIGGIVLFLSFLLVEENIKVSS
ncbi:MAG: hypothetical protein B6D55_03170 [Candidatus Omnitrophica bacterium 4484_70.2]|nr:MAG: hypothetical protein B6D55_03170 [Candidatus Omnitrophica bacterium 4484_70.2]